MKRYATELRSYSEKNQCGINIVFKKDVCIWKYTHFFHKKDYIYMLHEMQYKNQHLKKMITHNLILKIK